VEGYVLFVTGINEEADEMVIQELFGEYGAIKNLHVNADHKTGFRKGYAFIEFEKLEEAQSAILALDNTEFLDKKLRVSFAFMQVGFSFVSPTLCVLFIHCISPCVYVCMCVCV
jgi:RNA-binding protein 8A